MTASHDSTIIAAGIPYDVRGAQVLTWHDHGMTFDDRCAPRRNKAIAWCVLHWTASERAGERGARQIHRSLQARGLSVEFAITNEGTIWQYVDPLEQRCKHASRINPISVGVEVAGVGWVRKGRPLLGSATLRHQYIATVHGWTTRLFDYLPAQQRAVNALADALVNALGLHRHVLLSPWERRETALFMTQTGFCGHLHAASLRVRHPKTDPGPAPLESLQRYFELRKYFENKLPRG